jgi:cysteine desulfurase
MIYFDNNATTPLDERVLDAMMPFLKTMYGNPSSVHRLGRIAKSAVETAREQIAGLVDAPSAQIIFTSGGTEANNIALNSAMMMAKIAIGATEHSSIFEAAKRWQERGKTLDIIQVNSAGIIEENTIEQLICSCPDIVSIMLANNETGTIQAIEEIAAKLTPHGIRVHTDGVQALGKIPVSFRQLGVNLLSISSHKIYGPKGCGALIFDKSTPPHALTVGGGQEQNLRSGTENVAAIVGFGKAAELAKCEFNERHDKVFALKALLESELRKLSRVTLFSTHSQRLPNTVLFGLDSIDGEWVLLKLDQLGIAVSSGSACASEATEPSPVLLAMGVLANQAQTAIRVSLSHQNTADEILKFVEIIHSLGK